MQSELLDLMRNLSATEQRLMVDFAKALSASRPHGVAGADLARFAGKIPKDDLASMSAAIEAGCEQVDRDAW
jgi:hypothetical protein